MCAEQVQLQLTNILFIYSTVTNPTVGYRQGGFSTITDTLNGPHTPTGYRHARAARTSVLFCGL
jgi:hypothetical protein